MDLGLWWEDGRDFLDMWRGVEVVEPAGANGCKMASLAAMACSDVLDDVRAPSGAGLHFAFMFDTALPRHGNRCDCCLRVSTTPPPPPASLSPLAVPC
jgi:hypothetical protein